MKSNFSVKHIVATAVGAALFFVLGRFVAVPSGIQNTNISIQYGVLGFIGAVFGPIVGVFAGLIGHFLIDFSQVFQNGALGFSEVWWSWVIASGVCGLIMGLGMKGNKIDEGEVGRKDIIRFVVVSFISHLLSWVVVAPVLDILMYDEPVNIVFKQGTVSGAANFVTTAIVGGLLIYAYSMAVPKKEGLEEV